MSQDNLAIGTLLFYDGTALGGTITTRTNEIGAEVGDTISLNGWYVANGQSGTYDMIDYFIRAEAASNDAMLGDNDGFEATHTHTITASSNHDHDLNNTGGHTHTFPSSGSVWRTGATKDSGSGNASWGLWEYSSSAGAHTHTIGSAEGTHSHTCVSSGTAVADLNIPAYYSVIVIQKRS